MRAILFTITVFISLSCFSQTQSPTKRFPSITMVNDVVFKDSLYNHYNIGCGFLLLYNNDTLAITAKHILGVAHTDKMKTTNFENELKYWKMYPRDKKGQIVISETLLNEDVVDSTNFGYIGRHWYNYDDYLIFKVLKNNSNVKPVCIRNEPPREGERFYAIGWTYKDTEGEQREYEFEYVKNRGKMMLMKGIKAPLNGGGLSGSPVLDSNGKLVGIVSGGGKDQETGAQYQAMCDISYLIDFLNNLEAK